MKGFSSEFQVVEDTAPAQECCLEVRLVYGSDVSHPEPTILTCEVCGECFSSQEHLDKHHWQEHRDKPEGKYGCIYCPFTSVRRSTVTSHERSHTGQRPFVCKICHSRFMKPSHLKDHMRIHTKEKPFECDVCREAFTKKSNMLRHRQRHSANLKPYACPECKKCFRQKFLVRNHRLMMHVAPNKQNDS